MMMLAEAWYHVLMALLFGFFAALLILVILLQRGRGVGLSGAFGGAGGHTAFGAKTGDVLTWITVALALVILGLTVILNFFFRPATVATSTTAPVAPAGAPLQGTPPGQTPAQPAAETGAETESPAATPTDDADAPPAAPVDQNATTPTDAEVPAGDANTAPASSRLAPSVDDTVFARSAAVIFGAAEDI